jgi:hypothetical protein
MSKRFSVVAPLFFLACLAALCGAAFLGFTNNKWERRTFVFYAVGEKGRQLEERMLPRHTGGSALPEQAAEADMELYVEEYLLGPAATNLSPLFSRSTRLLSVLYRDGTAYIDLSEDALMPVFLERDAGLFRHAGAASGVKQSLKTFRESLHRNFPYLKDVKIFIAGSQIGADI